MKNQLVQYVASLFAGASNCEDMQQEITQNTLDRYDDLISQGKSPEAAFQLAIDGLGDLSQILSPAEFSRTHKSKKHSCARKHLYPIAIGLYICSVIPTILFEALGIEELGVSLMFLIVAIATVLLLCSRTQRTGCTASQQAQITRYRFQQAFWGFSTLGIYLAISFLTQAWYISWMVFPIMGCIRGIVRAIRDLKGGA